MKKGESARLVPDNDLARKEEADEVGVARELFHRLLERGDVFAPTAEDGEEAVPEGGRCFTWCPLLLANATARWRISFTGKAWADATGYGMGCVHSASISIMRAGASSICKR